MSKGSRENNTGRSSGTRRAAVSVVRGGKAHPLDERAAREREAEAKLQQASGRGDSGGSAVKGKAARTAGRGQYESDAQALADAWDPRKRAARQAREEAEEARAMAAAQDAAARAEDSEAKRAALRNIPEVVEKTPVIRVVAQDGTADAGGSSRSKGALGCNPLAEALTLPTIEPEPVAAPVEETAEVAAEVSAAAEAATDEREAVAEVAADEREVVAEAAIEEREAEASGALPTEQREQAPQSGGQAVGDPDDSFGEEQGELPEEDQGTPEAPKQKRPSAAPRRRSVSQPGAESDAAPEKKRRAVSVGKVVAIVVLVLLLVCAAVAGYAALSRWCWADDAGDVQGSWRLSGQKSSVVITQDTIDLAGQVTYTYTLDTQAKVIDETLGKMTGTARYRFSEDRNSLAIFDDGSTDWWANALSDLAWYRDCLFARIRGEAEPDLLHGESGIILYRQSIVATSDSNTAANTNENANADNASNAAGVVSTQDATSSATAGSTAASSN